MNYRAMATVFIELNRFSKGNRIVSERIARPVPAAFAAHKEQNAFAVTTV
jgi:hypothetical protein